VKSPLCGSVPVGPSLLCSGWGSGLTLNPIYIYIYVLLPWHLSLVMPLARAPALAVGTWLLHDMAITNIVWCMAYNRGVGGRLYIAQWSCNSIAVG